MEFNICVTSRVASCPVWIGPKAARVIACNFGGGGGSQPGGGLLHNNDDDDAHVTPLGRFDLQSHSA